MNAVIEKPDAWAVEAAGLPLAFAQVREDPRLDLELASVLPADATVVMIASGGETAVRLGALPLKNLHLVDMNPAQLALTRMKWHLAGDGDSGEVAALLGHAPMADRDERLRRVFGELGLEDEVFGPIDFLAEHGPDHAGRYERTFAKLREVLEPWSVEMAAMLRSGALADGLGEAMDAAFAKVMSLPNLVRLFGEAATQNPRREFHEHFAWRTREVIRRLPVSSNPFLWQILAGRFPEGHRYDWLQEPTVMRAEPVYHHGRMDEVLASMKESSVDLVHLSNILDWLTVDEASETLAHAHRALKPGGRLILRQLNSTLEVEELGAGLVWNTALGNAMEARDRSYFYPRIFVATRA